MASDDDTLPDAGIDPETLLKAQQAFDAKFAQIGGPASASLPPQDTQPPPFTPDAAPAPPQAITAPAAASSPMLSDQALPLDQSTPVSAPPSAGPAGAAVVPPVEGAAPPGAVPPQEIGPPPPGPTLTGDPTKDTAANLQWHRDLTAYQDKVNQHGAGLAQQQAALGRTKADRELKLEQNAATVRNDEQKRFAEENQQRRTANDKAVTEKADAYKDLGRGNGFLDQSLGNKVLGAIIFMLGSRSQALNNVAAIQSGHAPNAQNEGLNFIYRTMDERYKQKKDRLAAANDSALEARYGHKDALENHHAAMADLDSDAAANYRLAAKEVASQAAQLGSEQARQTGLETHAALIQKAQEYEGKMLQDQATLQEKREAAAATNNLAGAHLNLAERQAAATEAQRGETNSEARARIALTRDQMGLAHADRQDAISARKEAAEERKAAGLDARTARDPETGEPIGTAGSPRQVPDIEKGLVASHAYSASLRSLADDIEKNGRTGSDLPIIGTDAGRRRAQLTADAIERGRPAMQLGVSNANLQLEHQSVGGSGVGLDPHQMANPKVLRKMADEQDALAAKRARGMLAPIGGKPVAPIAGREMSEAPKAAPGAPANRPPVMKLGKVEYHLQADGTYK